jgi:hypothetical protein
LSVWGGFGFGVEHQLDEQLKYRCQPQIADLLRVAWVDVTNEAQDCLILASLVWFLNFGGVFNLGMGWRE